MPCAHRRRSYLVSNYVGTNVICSHLAEVGLWSSTAKAFASEGEVAGLIPIHWWPHFNSGMTRTALWAYAKKRKKETSGGRNHAGSSIIALVLLCDVKFSYFSFFGYSKITSTGYTLREKKKEAGKK